MKSETAIFLFQRLALMLCISILLPANAQVQSGEVEADDYVEIPDTAAGRNMEWVLRVINGDTPLGEPSDRFSDRFLEDFKPGELTKELTSIRVDGLEGQPARPVSIDQNDSEESLTITIRGKGTNRFLSVFLAMDADLRKISGLVVNIAMGFDGESDWAAFDGELGNAKGTASFAAYEIVSVKGPDGAMRSRLSPVHAFREDKVLPIASAFKIWVLGALAESVRDGVISLDERVTLYDNIRSLPSGRMRDDPPGARHRVATLAASMIAESDNTATDLLITRMSRERVEAFMRSVTDDPALNTPLLTTREMFSLKVPTRPWVRDEYLESDEAHRRSMLAPGGRLFRESPDAWMLRYWKRPVLVTQAEWFASCGDLCRAMMRVHELSKVRGLESVRAALGVNRGVMSEDPRWSFVGFKGGSEPGVLSFCYIMTRDDGRTFVMAAIQASEQDALDQDPFNELARRGAALLARFE